MVVAIDGPAGVGKSTIANLIAEKTGLFYVNSGNFYRAYTYYILKNNISKDNETDIINAVNECELSIKNNMLHLNNENIEDELHTDLVDKNVAAISSIIEIRKKVNTRIQEISKDLNIIIEGRDMTTVVFPNAEIKYYLDASIKVRAQRRFKQGVSKLSYEDIYNNIKNRDEIDKNKKQGSLKISSDAEYLDTSDLTIEEVCEKVSLKINGIIK